MSRPTGSTTTIRKANQSVPRILLVTPAPANTTTGNRVSALRWARILRENGHRVRVAADYVGGDWDLMIALHAAKSACAVREFRRSGDRPVILVLTGTDLYRDLRTQKAAQHTVEAADRLVVLQPRALRSLPSESQSKTIVIPQSAMAPRRRPTPFADRFEVCVSGHLRAVKDPFRTAIAARRLPVDSRIVVSHLGTAMTSAMRHRAEAERESNRRYRWYGGVSRWRAKQFLARSRLLVVSSKLEGGPNVVSEAIVCDVPVLGTRIDGVMGLLGEDYPGYFEVGATAQLTELLSRCERDKRFYRDLVNACRRRARLFHPAREATAWNLLVANVIDARKPNETRPPRSSRRPHRNG